MEGEHPTKVDNRFSETEITTRSLVIILLSDNIMTSNNRYDSEDVSAPKRPKIDYTDDNSVVTSVLKTLEYEMGEEQEKLKRLEDSLSASSVSAGGDLDAQDGGIAIMTRLERERQKAEMIAAVERTARDIRTVRALAETKKDETMLLEKQLTRSVENNIHRVEENSDQLQRLAEGVRLGEEGWLSRVEAAVARVIERAKTTDELDERQRSCAVASVLELTYRMCKMAKEDPTLIIPICLFVGDRIRMNVLHRYATTRNIMNMVIHSELRGVPPEATGGEAMEVSPKQREEFMEQTRGIMDAVLCQRVNIDPEVQRIETDNEEEKMSVDM